MKRMAVILIVVVAFVLLSSTAWAAETFGIVPTLARADQPIVDTQAESPVELPGETPIIVLGLEFMSWFGPDASVGYGLTAKHEIGGGWDPVDGKFFCGWLVGITEPGTEDGTNIATGAILELAIGEIPAISVLFRLDDGDLLLNPGVNVTLFGAMF